MTWDDIKKKYGSEERDSMSEEREKEYVQDAFAAYEAEGFAKRFWTAYEENSKHIGKSFTVVGRVGMDRADLCTLPMWDIRFGDGQQTTAYPEEIIEREMVNNGCDLEGLEREALKRINEEARTYAVRESTKNEIATLLYDYDNEDPEWAVGIEDFYAQLQAVAENWEIITKDEITEEDAEPNEFNERIYATRRAIKEKIDRLLDAHKQGEIADAKTLYDMLWEINNEWDETLTIELY
jgi:hypothetical protein